MELLFAGPASLLGQGVVGAMDNGEADHTVFNSFKALVHVVLPQSQALHYAAVLNTFMFMAFNESLFAPISDLFIFEIYILATTNLSFYLMCEIGAQLQHPVPPLL